MVLRENLCHLKLLMHDPVDFPQPLIRISCAYPVKLGQVVKGFYALISFCWISCGKKTPKVL